MGAGGPHTQGAHGRRPLHTRPKAAPHRGHGRRPLHTRPKAAPHRGHGRRPLHTRPRAAPHKGQGRRPLHTRPNAASHKAKGRLTHWPLGDGPVHKTRRVVHCTGTCKPRAAFSHMGASTAHLIHAHIWQTTQHTRAHKVGPVTQAPRHAHTARVGVSASPHSTTRTAGPGTQRSILHMTPLAV